MGNGRIGAMCFGDPAHDRFDLNDDRCWSGDPSAEFRRGAVEAGAARDAIGRAWSAVARKRWDDADRAVRTLQQSYTQAFLPLGALQVNWLDAPDDLKVTRRLELDTALHELQARNADVIFERTTIISAVAEVMLVRTTMSRPSTFDIAIGTELRIAETQPIDGGVQLVLALPSDVAPTHEDTRTPITWGEGAGLMGIALRAEADGPITRNGSRLTVSNATRLLLAITTASSFRGIGEWPDANIRDELAKAAARGDAAIATGWEAIRAAQQRDHAALYDRCTLEIAASKSHQTDTSRRLRLARASVDPFAADPGLAVLLFHYGRYLLICSSRPGTLPATLQGIWNNAMQPPWSSNYTINVNTQMNYWAAESTGLGECHEPVIDLVEALARRGHEVARRLYGCGGWTAHHNTDAWAFASPVGRGDGDPAWAFWPMAGLWLVRHLVVHLRHNTTRGVADRVWPLLHGAVEFGLDWCGELDSGERGPQLSTSPENSFGTTNGRAAVGRASSIDLALLVEALSDLIALAADLGFDDDPLLRRARQELPRLAPIRRGSDGGVREWYDDQTPVDPHHRHLSSLYAVYPGRRTDLDAEARRTLELRGEEGSGWSLVWKACLRARIGDADRVHDLISLMLRDADEDRGSWSGGLYPNLFASHPPFQIDANLGFPAVVVECLVAERDGEIHLLPSVPRPLADDGRVRGLVLAGGLRVDIGWRASRVTDCRLSSPIDRVLSIRANGNTHTIRIDADCDLVLTHSDLEQGES